MTSTDAPYKLRPYNVDTDKSFVYDSWLRSYRKYADVIPYAIYHRVYTAIIDRLVESPGVQITIACNPHRDDQIYGHICHGPGNVIHYIYIKERFRGCDIEHTLLTHATSDEPFEFTFRTKYRALFRDQRGEYHPALIRGDLS